MSTANQTLPAGKKPKTKPGARKAKNGAAPARGRGGEPAGSDESTELNSNKSAKRPKASAKLEAKSVKLEAKRAKLKAEQGSSSGKAKAKAKSKAKLKLSAKTADLYDLYERSVQDPDTEVALLDRVFKKLRGRRPLSLREDFCGTGLLCAKWVASHPERTAVGVDLDAAVLASGRTRHLEPLGEAASRVSLLQQDVREKTNQRFDLVCAYNFSYWIFTERRELRAYFESVRESLAADGVLAVDAYGGTEAMLPLEEERKITGGFTYVWEQAEFNPIDHYALNHIHFRFKDGTSLKRAFSYAWRFWTLPELQELLHEAGFSEVTVYWDIAPEDEDADYRPRKVVENQLGWVCYLMARK